MSAKMILSLAGLGANGECGRKGTSIAAGIKKNFTEGEPKIIAAKQKVAGPHGGMARKWLPGSPCASCRLVVFLRPCANLLESCKSQSKMTWTCFSVLCEVTCPRLLALTLVIFDH